jgi:phosphoribosylanthranilate isomerase
VTAVKICGITNLADGLAAARAGCDLLGFVFYPRSPRCVTPAQAKELVARLRESGPARGLRCVGVFVDEAPDVVARTLTFCGLDLGQLHGSEPPEAVAALGKQGHSVITALRVRDGASLNQIDTYRADIYLLDAYVPGQMGGTGQRFDWRLARQAADHRQVLLAGGLTPENVADAVRTARPWGVDVSSGVEASPGRKDHGKIRRFIAAAKGRGA